MSQVLLEAGPERFEALPESGDLSWSQFHCRSVGRVDLRPTTTSEREDDQGGCRYDRSQYATSASLAKGLEHSLRAFDDLKHSVGRDPAGDDLIRARGPVNLDLVGALMLTETEVERQQAVSEVAGIAVMDPDI